MLNSQVMTEILKRKRKRKFVSQIKETSPSLLTRFNYLVSVLMPLLALLAFIFFVGLLYNKVNNDSIFPLKRMVLNNDIVYGDKMELLNLLENSKDDDFIRLDVTKLAKKFETLSWVISAQVEIEWPDAIRVNIQERVPVARWGDEQFVDINGVIFQLPPNKDLHALFKLHGPRNSAKKVLDFYRAIDAWMISNGVVMKELFLDERNAWNIILEGDIKVIVGYDDLQNRLKRLVIVNNQLLKANRKYIAVINLRYKEGCSVLLRNGVSFNGENRSAKQ